LVITETRVQKIRPLPSVITDSAPIGPVPRKLRRRSGRFHGNWGADRAGRLASRRSASGSPGHV